jgi:protein-L-isoaspartate(D-aspartate) O-methyltransferase
MDRKHGATRTTKGRRLFALGLLVALVIAIAPPAVPAADLEDARRQLVEQIAEHARLVGPVTGRPEFDPAILGAIRSLPRHVFVEAKAAPFAYLDVALPAEHGLRESQPYIVALMTEVVAVDPGHKVLILGVGGGYHAALAHELGAEVFIVDLEAAAVASVSARLADQHFSGIHLRVGDPYDGWPEIDRQFDAIIVRLAIDRISPMLYRQLAPGGRLVAPIGPADDGQLLTLVSRGADNTFTARTILPVRFMRLPGGERL